MLFVVVGPAELVEMDAECDINSSSSWDHLSGFEGSLGHADGVMDGPGYDGLYLSTSSSMY